MSGVAEYDRVALEAVAEKLQLAVAALSQALQDLDSRDHRLMVALRQKYSLPQRVTEVFESIVDLGRVLKL